MKLSEVIWIVFSTVSELLFVNSLIFFGIMKAFISKDQYLMELLVLGGVVNLLFHFGTGIFISHSS